MVVYIKAMASWSKDRVRAFDCCFRWIVHQDSKLQRYTQGIDYGRYHSSKTQGDKEGVEDHIACYPNLKRAGLQNTECIVFVLEID
jgi:hypothetical protein